MKLVFSAIAVQLVVGFVVVSADELPDDCRDARRYTKMLCDKEDGFRFDLEANKCVPVRLDCNHRQNFFPTEVECEYLCPSKKCDNELPKNCIDATYFSMIGCPKKDGFRYDLDANKCVHVRHDCTVKPL